MTLNREKVQKLVELNQKERWNTKTCSQHSYWERRVKVMPIVTYLIILNSIELKISIPIL